MPIPRKMLHKMIWLWRRIYRIGRMIKLTRISKDRTA